MVKTFQNLLLQNQKSYDLETWHVSLGTQPLQSFINDDPGLTLTYFTQGKIGTHVRLNGETVTKSFNGRKLAAKDCID